MGLDVRLPIGLMFAIVGVLLAGYGTLGPGTEGSSINVWWGLVLVVFGGLMLWLSRRSVSALKRPEQ